MVYSELCEYYNYGILESFDTFFVLRMYKGMVLSTCNQLDMKTELDCHWALDC